MYMGWDGREYKDAEMDNMLENYCDECGKRLHGHDTHYDGERVLCRDCSDKKPCKAAWCSWHRPEEGD